MVQTEGPDTKAQIEARMNEKNRNRGIVLVELVRLVVVAFCTAAGFQVARGIVTDVNSGRIVLGAVMGSLVGYVAGGFVGRSVATLVGLAERRIAAVPGADIVAGSMGTVAGLV